MRITQVRKNHGFKNDILMILRTELKVNEGHSHIPMHYYNSRPKQKLKLTLHFFQMYLN